MDVHRRKWFVWPFALLQTWSGVWQKGSLYNILPKVFAYTQSHTLPILGKSCRRKSYKVNEWTLRWECPKKCQKKWKYRTKKRNGDARATEKRRKKKKEREKVFYNEKHASCVGINGRHFATTISIYYGLPLSSRIKQFIYCICPNVAAAAAANELVKFALLHYIIFMSSENSTLCTQPYNCCHDSSAFFFVCVLLARISFFIDVW